MSWLVTLSIDEVQLEINRVGESENTRKLKQIGKRKILQSCSQVRSKILEVEGGGEVGLTLPGLDFFFYYYFKKK